MRPTALLALALALCVGTCCFAQDGGGRRRRRPDGDRYRPDYYDHYTSETRRGTPSGPYPRLMLGFTRGKEITPTRASWGWSYVESASEEAVERQKARDDAFKSALADWRKTFPWRSLEGEE